MHLICLLFRENKNNLLGFDLSGKNALKILKIFKNAIIKITYSKLLNMKLDFVFYFIQKAI